MPVNSNKPHKWKADIAQSVNMFNTIQTQEPRQPAAIKAWLDAHGYTQISSGECFCVAAMQPGAFSIGVNVPVKNKNGVQNTSVKIDAVIMPKGTKAKKLPFFFDTKSVGDSISTSKIRRESAVKMVKLRDAYGKKAQLNLFLCGYFDGAYLGYVAAEGIDWVWEHRINDLVRFGI
jgi:type II restriction enzyme